MATSPICSIADCGKHAVRRGWCHAHYNRCLRHGDPLGGGPALTPQGESLRYFNEVVLNYDGRSCLIWPYGRDAKGRGRLFYEGKTRIVSRIACEHVNGAPPTPEHQAAHNCGNGAGGCVAKRHVKWKTQIENMADLIRHGASSRGSRHARAILKEVDIPKIRALAGKLTHREIAEIYGISTNGISNVLSGHSWSWVGGGDQ